MVEDVANGQEVAHCASGPANTLTVREDAARDGQVVRLQVRVAVQKELLGRQRLLELQRLVYCSAAAREPTAGLHGDEDVQDLPEGREDLLTAAAHDVQHRVQLVEQVRRPRAAHRRLHICASHRRDAPTRQDRAVQNTHAARHAAPRALAHQQRQRAHAHWHHLQGQRQWLRGTLAQQ